MKTSFLFVVGFMLLLMGIGLAIVAWHYKSHSMMMPNFKGQTMSPEDGFVVSMGVALIGLLWIYFGWKQSKDRGDSDARKI